MKSKSRFVMVAALFMPIGPFVLAVEVAPAAKPVEEFQYAMSQKNIDVIESKVAGLRKGTSLDDVRSLLGKPTSDRVLYSKRFVGKGRFIAHEIVYVLKRVRINGNNARDQMISIFFDEKGRLMKIARLGYSKTNSFKIIGGTQIVEVILE